MVFSDELNLPLMGKGFYSWFFINIYEATFWARPDTELYTSPLVLELHYKRNFKGRDIVDQSLKELSRGGISDKELEVWKLKLIEIFPDVKQEDKIQARFTPQTGIAFYLNSNKELGRIEDVNFSKKFLDIWLGEKTSAPDLRLKLLGLKK